MTELFDWEMVDDRQRSFEVNGKKFVAKASDPYGFWTLYEYESGGKEKELPGTYTSLLSATTQAKVIAGNIKEEKKAAQAKKAVN